MKKVVFTRIDTSETAPENQGELLRVWDRSWKLRGWKTKMLFPGNLTPLGAVVFSYWTINFSYRPAMKSYTTRSFGDEEWMTADVVKFRADVTELQILECGRSLV